MSNEELIDIITENVHHGLLSYDACTPHAEIETAADLILAAGYRKPTILGYIVVGRDGHILGAQYPTKDAAQVMADEWTKDCEEAGVDWDYRVAEIVEPTA